MKNVFRRATPWVVGAAALVGTPGIVAAQDAPNERATVSAEVGFALYVWAPSIDGEISAAGSTADLDVSFFDVLDESDHVIGFMGQVELNINRFLVLLDPVWTRVQKDASDQNGNDLDIEIDMLWFDLDLGYRFVDDAPLGGEDSATRISVDGFVGGRLSSFSLELEPDAGEDISQTQTWADPLVGGRVTLDFGRRVGLELRGDIGGFGAGSELSSLLSGVIGYRFAMGDVGAAVFAGYRALYQDYEDGDFEWDAWVHGPVLGVKFSF